MNNETIKKINKEIMNANVNITIKDFEGIVRELREKDKEIRELKKLTTGLENQLWEFEEDYDDLEKENTKLKKEKENLEDECFELEEENNKLTAELKEVKSENMKLKMEKIAKKIQESDITFSEDLAKYIANAGLISLKSCLNSMDSLEK